MEELTLQESSRLLQLERIVTAGLQSWIEVGEALIEIRDSRLYKIEANTFEEYCQTRFKIARTTAYQLIGNTEVAKQVSAAADISERAIRELKKAPEERRQEIFDKATETAQGHVPTAREIKQIVNLDEEREVYPVERIQVSEESKRAGEEARSESESLFNLKWNWKRANRRDREAFTSWIQMQ